MLRTGGVILGRGAGGGGGIIRGGYGEGGGIRGRSSRQIKREDYVEFKYHIETESSVPNCDNSMGTQRLSKSKNKKMLAMEVRIRLWLEVM